jgi:hypothetical protein
MKTNILLVVIVALLLASCTPGIPSQEIKVTDSIPTKVSFTEAPMTQQPVATETPTATATETPTNVPSQTPPSCLTLLTPPNNDELPGMGRVIFSWRPVNEATYYALNIVSPSGETVSFETKQPFRALYLESIPAAGTYQWKVIAEDRKRQEICSSELATFSKPFYEQPNQPRTNTKKRKK